MSFASNIVKALNDKYSVLKPLYPSVFSRLNIVFIIQMA